MKINELVQVKKKKGKGNSEFAGPCPFCGGNDRFITWPESGKTGAFWCRGCKRSGDGLELIRELQGLSFLQAVSAWGLKPEDFPKTGRPKVKRVWAPKEKNGVPAEWSNMAEIFLEESEFQLIKNHKIRDYLHGRGLTDETIRAARLGWNPKDEFHTRTLWGLDIATDDQGKPIRTYLKAGLVISHVKDGKVIGLKIRKANPDAGGKYTHVAGSASVPMTWGTGSVWVIVESELDGWLLWQECNDLAEVGVIALGSASMRPDQETHEVLKGAGLILVALDTDAAGAREAWGWWNRNYKNVKRWPVPVGKDPSEAVQKGLSLRAWVLAGLPESFPIPERLPESCTTITPEPTTSTRPAPTPATTNQGPPVATIPAKGYRARGAARRTVFEPFPPEWKARYTEDELERLVIMTVDGGMTDTAAENRIIH